MAGQDTVERFPATTGRLGGTVVAALGLALLALAVAEHDEAWAVTAGLAGVLVAGLAWASMLRPALGVDGDALVMRGMVDTVRIPLAAIEQVVVRQVLAVRAGDRRYVSPAVGKSRRAVVRGDRHGGPAIQPGRDIDPADFVEERIRRLAEDARTARGIRLMSDEQVALGRDVRRRWDWPVLALLAVPAVLLAVSLLV